MKRLLLILIVTLIASANKCKPAGDERPPNPPPKLGDTSQKYKNLQDKREELKPTNPADP